MKSFGSIMSFKKQRNYALLKEYRKVIANVSVIRLKDICEIIVNSPSPRFWVSEERATAVISAMIRGKDVLSSMRASKREMFNEIYKRVMAIKRKGDNSHLNKIVFSVVNSPAPKFYMKASSAIEILFKVRNGYYERNKKW